MCAYFDLDDETVPILGNRRFDAMKSRVKFLLRPYRNRSTVSVEPSMTNPVISLAFYISDLQFIENMVESDLNPRYNCDQDKAEIRSLLNTATDLLVCCPMK